MSLGWYLRRLSRMSPREVVGRVRDALRKRRWRRRQVRDAEADPLPVPRQQLAAPGGVPAGDELGVSPAAREAVRAAADELLAGRWEVLGIPIEGLGPDPDWFLDPRTGKRAPSDRYAFAIDHRDADRHGIPKYVWELSRHSHLTLLAFAWRLTGDDRYAELAVAQLRSWCRHNPFLSGIHWTSGIELGLRLVAWVWMRRLLDGWPAVERSFEGDPVFVQQVHHHLDWLDAFASHGTSANNHLVAEAAGAFVAACAFPWFGESPRWRRRAAERLTRALRDQTFDSGLNRELATEYHGFVLELGLVAAVEGERAGHSLGGEVHALLALQADALAAIVDDGLRPPRQGDGDDGCALRVDAPDADRTASLLATAAALLGSRDWWPAVPEGDPRAALLAAHGPLPAAETERADTRPTHFADAGLTVLRASTPSGREVWTRLDAGPHGFSAVAGHAHADALALELRVAGQDLLADPGTYTYHGEPKWRRRFRSTLGHNTLELEDVDQSVAGGEFFWTRHAASELMALEEEGEELLWQARHDGYTRLSPPAVHERTVRLTRKGATLRLRDEVLREGASNVRLAFHLGPDVDCQLSGACARLELVAGGKPVRALLRLPEALGWSAVRGDEERALGWYSPRFGEKVPATTLIGEGRVEAGHVLETVLRFEDEDHGGSDA